MSKTDFTYKIYRKDEGMDSDILRYSIQLAMLKQLLTRKLINKNEYFKIKDVLMKDYKISSDLT